MEQFEIAFVGCFVEVKSFLMVCRVGFVGRSLEEKINLAVSLHLSWFHLMKEAGVSVNSASFSGRTQFAPNGI